MRLTGRGHVSKSDLFILLEAGLQAMEETIAAREEGTCGNPDCVACRTRSGEEPNKGLMAEFDLVNGRLQESASQREAGHDAGQSVSILVSEAGLIFAAWLDRLARQRATGGLRLVKPEIDLSNPADMEGAGRFLANLLVVALEREFEGFATGTHPLLYPMKGQQGPGPTIH